MIKPKRLNAGDTVRIVAPASPVRREMFEQGLVTLKNLGFETVYRDPFVRWRYLAGEDQHRKAELLEALQDSASRAIIFARGGYGCSRLVNGSSLKKVYEPKILLGCSDITTLHLYFQRHHRWIVFHGPMVSGDFARGQVHVESFRLALMQTEPYRLDPPGVEVLRSGMAEGVLTGGCMTLLDASIGTGWEPEWADAVLFLEDVAIKPYQIDRMLTHLKASGKLNSVKAFVFGEMKDCVQVENQGYLLQEVILDVIGDLGKPIYFNFPSGHVNGMNWTLPFGVRARVSFDSTFRLEILEGAVL